MNSQVPGDANPLFGEALAFYEIPGPQAELLVVYRPLVDLCQNLRQWKGIWGAQVVTARVSSVQGLVGVWRGIRTKNIHILRKHPGLELLSNMERGNGAEDAGEEAEQS